MPQIVVNHCPFGCEKVDEHGFCFHIVGFTNDGKTVELITRVKDLRDRLPARLGTPQTGLKRREVEAGDKVVNPEYDQFDQQTGMTHKAKTWVSARVYRKDAIDPATLPEFEEPEPGRSEPPHWMAQALSREMTDQEMDDATKPEPATAGV